MNNTMESGRHNTGQPLAKSGTKPPKQGKTDSGGGVFQPVQKPVAGINGKPVKFYGK